MLEVLTGLVSSDSQSFSLDPIILTDLVDKHKLDPFHPVWTQWPSIAYNLLVHLYFRRPGLISSFHSSRTYQIVCNPPHESDLNSGLNKFGSLIPFSLVNVRQSEVI